MAASYQSLQQFGSLRPQRATAPFVSLSVQPHAQWTIDVDIGDTQVCNLLHPGSGVIEDHEESSITKRHHTLFGQSMKEILDFIALQIVGLRRRSALRRDRFHTLGFSQHLRMMNS